MKRRLSLYILLTISLMQVFAQTDSMWDVPRVGGETVTEPSPEATAMRRYQDFPVSYATGTADVSIPLLELPGGQTGVSLGLRYHTGGIKRNDISTGVGLGWSLTGLGQVSRQINGFPDEWKGRVGSQGVRFQLKTLSDDLDYFIDMLNGKVDAEYDVYSYSFPGYSGSFILKRNIIGYEIVQLPATDLTIERVANATDDDATDAFIITTPDGTEYTFDVKEHIEYHYIASHMSLPLKDMDYDAVSTWHVSKIVAPERSDSISVTYTSQGEWRRTHYANLRSVQVKYSTNSEGSGFIPQTVDESCSPYTQFNDQRLPLSITSRSGSVSFDIRRNVNSVQYGAPDCIRTIQLRNKSGEIIKSVTFNNGSHFTDGRQRLDDVTVSQDGCITDKYTFTYNDATVNTGYDLFGYSNNCLNSQSCRSILDHDLMPAKERIPNEAFITANSLKTITDIAGAKTTLSYEPSKVIVGDRDFSVINGEITVGVRLKSIETMDSKGTRSRVRAFEYENAVCDVDLSCLSIDMFLSQSGTMTAEPTGGMYLYEVAYLNTLFTASSKTRGYPVDNAAVYYSRVSETLTGTGIDYPIKTVYEYDLSGCIKPYVRVGGGGGNPLPGTGGTSRISKYLGDTQHVTFFPSPVYARILSAHRTAGYYKHVYGGAPLLTRKYTYEYTGGDYQLRSKEEQFYSSTDSVEMTDGLFCESVVYRTRKWYDNVESQLNVDSFNDVNFYWTTVEAYRTVCDSAVTTIYYPDGNSRSVHTHLLYDAKFIPNDSPLRPGRPTVTGGLIEIGSYLAPGFHCDTIGAPMGHRSFYPLGKVVSSGNESVAYYNAMSEYAGVKLKTAGCKLKRLPVVEKWVLQTSEGCDSLLRHYEYGRFSYGGHTLTRPTRVYVQTDGAEDSRALISSQQYTSYDRRGRITSMVSSDGYHISASWNDDYDMLSEMSLADVGLTTRYGSRPLVGYTSIEGPSGRTRRFSYTAGRLESERNTANEPVASYTYTLAGDGTSADGRNRFTTTVHDTSGTATETTYYDGFGLPVQTVSTAAGGNLVRSVTEYDAIDRVKRKYLPFPAGSTDYSTDYASEAVSYYGDDTPYSVISYPYMSTDRPQTVYGEGAKMARHPHQFEYICNSATETELKCRRYRLSADRSGETIKLDGYYPGGALDVTRATDPDGCSTLTFTDWRGLTILRRSIVDGTTFADTYYLYDILGNVRVIIQPEGSAMMTTDTRTWTQNDNVVQQYTFVYRYDRRGNCIYTRNPGAGPTTMLYDPLNRLAFRAGYELSEDGETEVFMYDPIGRPVISGICNMPISSVGQVPEMTVRYTPGCGGIDGTDYMAGNGMSGFADAVIPTVVNYYDSYDCLSIAGFDALKTRFTAGNASTAAGNLTATRTSYYYSQGGVRTMSRVDDSLYTLYGYDTEGRVVAQASSTILPGWETTKSDSYSRQGHVTSSKFVLYSSTGAQYDLTGENEYDALGNPLKSKYTYSMSQSGIGLIPTPATAQYTYNDRGLLDEVNYGNTSVKYGYNIRGQVTSILAPKVFSQQLKYEDAEQPCYNGNISEMCLEDINGLPTTRRFSYDRLNRLTAMTSTDGFNTAYTYSLNSSPLTIVRYGLKSDRSVGVVDDLTLSYDGNRLTAVHDAADRVTLESSLDFDGSSSYTYDCDGRLYSDSHKGIGSIKYSPLGNPVGIYDIFNKSIAEYKYSATGEKLHSYISNSMRLIPLDDRYYIGPFEFIKKNILSVEPDLDRINLPWGYKTNSSAEYVYIKDYQGNIRAVTDSKGTVIQSTDYYPYGMPMATSTGAEVNRYKYSGKELETNRGLNFYDFDARMCDVGAPMFNRMDDYGYMYPWYNPYLYCGGDPVNCIDQHGDSVQAVSKISGIRMLNVIHTTFSDKRFKELRSLFKLEEDGMTMSSIDRNAFNNATKNLSEDEIMLAYAYYLAINHNETHYVDMCMRNEKLNKKTIKVFDELRYYTGSQIDVQGGGGINRKLNGGGTFSVIIMDSNKDVDFVYVNGGMHYKRKSTPGELFCHEVLGHGLGLEEGSLTFRHEDAIQLTNLYWRVKGYTNFYRNGCDHFNGRILDFNTATGIPAYLRQIH